jgi:hypothetical protein
VSQSLKTQSGSLLKERIERIEVPVPVSPLWPREDFAVALDQKESRLYIAGGTWYGADSKRIRINDIGLLSLDLRISSAVRSNHDRQRDIMVRG